MSVKFAFTFALSIVVEALNEFIIDIVPLPLRLIAFPLPFLATSCYQSGMTKDAQKKTYVTWIGMRARCNNPNHPKFHHYGGRRIRVCKRWDSFANFLADMGDKPKGLSLERNDVDGDYKPSNCRWATQKEQMRNLRITRRVKVGGKSYVAADLADQLGVKTDTIVSRAKVCKTYSELMDPNRRVFTDGLALGGIANGERQRSKTHCPRGHAYDAENTYYTKEGWRNCRKCKCIKEQKRRDKR
jgi:hypothetical protein